MRANMIKKPIVAILHGPETSGGPKAVETTFIRHRCRNDERPGHFFKI